MSDTAVDLTFVTTESMWEELCKRFIAIVLVAEAELTDGKTNMVVMWSGTCTHCMGLSRYAEQWVLMEARREATEDDDE